LNQNSPQETFRRARNFHIDEQPFAGFPGTVFLNQGNGAVDLIGGSNASRLEIWPNNGTLGFSGSPIAVPPPTTAYSTVADMDHD
jgi:hypothetical protein